MKTEIEHLEEAIRNMRSARFILHEAGNMLMHDDIYELERKLAILVADMKKNAKDVL